MEAITASLTTLLSFLLFTTSPQQTLADQNSTIQDPYALLHVIRNPDGSLTRPAQYFPTVPPNTSTLSFSKDVHLNPAKNTWIRIYLPNGSVHPRPGKLPVLVFSHGGGFIILSPANPKVDAFCSAASNRVNALVVSVDYRLAPEHRLPAAYDDVLEALHWVKEGKDEWVRKYGDISRCVLMGVSAGGNIAYTLGLRVSTLVNDLKPLIIKGLVLIQPFFGGVKRTSSELTNPTALPLVVNDLVWELSLPISANRNHMYCNPIIGGRSYELNDIRELGWRVGFVGCDGDPLFDRQVELVKLLERYKVNVIAKFSKGGYHGMFSNEINKAKVVFQVVRSVLSSSPVN